MDFGYDPPERFRTASDQAHEIVARELGHDDFGPGDYLHGLKVMLQSMDYDPHFTEQGRRAAWGQVIGVLRSRAGAFKAMKDNPGFDAEAITSPVVITGVPRTGTTALHRLMAVDQRFQGLQTWLLDAPMPRPPLSEWESYPEYRKTVAVLEARYAAAPQKRAAHHIAAEEVHECCMLLRQSFVSNLWSCGWSAPTYDAWWQCQSEQAAYDYYYRCVQLIGSNDRDKRWLLKNPGHIENLDLLFAVFPEAKVIQTHRDPAKAVPSLVSLLMTLHPTMEEGRADQRAANMLEREVAKWANAVRKADAVRQRHPGKVLDVVHLDFHRNPMDVLDRIYAFIGMDIPDTTRAQFAQRIEEKPELQHGVHRYSIADYGMTPEQAREPFGDYIERFDLVEKGK
ncbi:sulfotransferase [Novosphingobium sp. BL-8A]|uniref:sulfotransferase family protein n=1 Tax=Novosphingobium sp. BL-8A TaxID=3127639 RepID=UPI0037573DD4